MSTYTDQWHASLNLGFGRDATGRSVLKVREHKGPLLVQRALYPEGSDTCHVALIHPPSGIAGGDNLSISVNVSEKAYATVFSPGSTRWYKSNGRLASQSVHIQVSKGSRLDWLPLENIIFEEAQALTKTTIELDSGAIAIGWDAFQLGRVNKPNYWDVGSIHTETHLNVDGKLLWIDQGLIQADDPIRTSLSGMANFPAHAVLWCFGPTMDATTYETLTKELPWTDELRGASTCIPYKQHETLYLVRCLGIHMEEVRAVLERAWALLRTHVLHAAPTPLRLWAT